MWTKVMLFILIQVVNYQNKLLSLFYQAKRKQALLESNLSGIYLMFDKNVNQRELLQFLLIFLENLMPLKTHL